LETPRPVNPNNSFPEARAVTASDPAVEEIMDFIARVYSWHDP